MIFRSPDDEYGDEAGYDHFTKDGEPKGGAYAPADPYSPGTGYPQQQGYQPPPQNFGAPPPDYNGVRMAGTPDQSFQLQDPNVSRGSAADTFV